MRNRFRLVMFVLSGLSLFLVIDAPFFGIVPLVVFIGLGLAVDRVFIVWGNVLRMLGGVEGALKMYASVAVKGEWRELQREMLIEGCLRDNIDSFDALLMLKEAATQVVELHEGIRAAKKAGVSSSFITRLRAEANRVSNVVWGLAGKMAKASVAAKKQKMDSSAFEKRLKTKYEEIKSLTKATRELRKYLSEMTVSTALAGSSSDVLNLAEEQLRVLAQTAKELSDASM